MKSKQRGMEVLTVNISGKVRQRRMGGKDYLVAPVRMLKEGVLNGSNGPLLYPLDEISRNPDDWNHMPILKDHPFMHGKPVSGRDPEILNAQGMGMILKAKATKASLDAEGWFEVEATKRVSLDIYNALVAGEPLELSTGLFVTQEDSEGVFNGTSYKAIARNFKPDHLAVFTNQKGACSIKDGCGVLVNSAGEEVGVVLNQPSHSELHTALDKLLRERFGSSAYLLDVYDKFCVYSASGATWKLGYTTDLRGDDSIDLDNAEPVEVRRKITYVTVNGEDGQVGSLATSTQEPTMALKQEERKQLIDKLISNGCGCWSEEDRAVLANFKDERLQTLVSNAEKVKDLEEREANRVAVENAAREGAKPAPAPAPAPVANAEAAKPKTKDEWLADAPAEIRTVVQNAMAQEQRQKDAVVARITANARNKFTKEQLNAKPLSELEAIAALLPEPAPAYAGASAPAFNAMYGDDDDAPLPLPSYNAEFKAQATK